MENVVMTTFAVESEAYEAFTALKNKAVNDDYTLIAAAIVKNEGGRIVVQDSFDTGATFNNDTLKGGLIGAVVGILGGPIGVLLGGAAGLMIGNDMDVSDAVDNSSVLEYVSGNLGQNQVAVISLVQESNESAFDAAFAGYRVTFMRWDATEIAKEVEHAAAVQKQMAKEARKRLREARRAARQG